MKYFLTVVLWISLCDLTGQSPKPTRPLSNISSNDLLDQNTSNLIDLCEKVRFSNPDSLYMLAHQVYDMGTQKKQAVIQAWGEVYLGIYYSMTGKTVQALELAQKNISIISAKKNQQVLLGKLYSLGGISLMKLNRQREALDIFYTYLRIAESIADGPGQVKATNNIGWAFMELNQFEKAIAYFKKALQLISNNNLPDKHGTIYNNLASCFGSLNLYDSAYKFARRGIEIAKENNDLIAQANGLNIMGNFLTKQGRYKEALECFLTSKPIREKTGDPFYIVSDLAEIANLQATLGDTTKGIRNCMTALEIAEKNKIDAKLPMIYASLIHNYEVGGNFKAAAETYKKSEVLKDKLYANANPTALAEIQTKYETEQKEMQIQQQQFAITKRNYWIAGIIGVLLLVGLLAFSWNHRNKLKQETLLQSEIIRQQKMSATAVLEAEENERQRIARDLHDGIGQIMSAAKMNLSAIENELPFKDEQRVKFNRIIELVDESCREVRMVSHNMMPNVLVKAGLAAAVREFINKVDSSILKIKLHDEGLYDRLENNVETILYRVVQECVNNVIKHSAATNLNISLIKDRDGISATIEDNGVGFDTMNGSRYKGMGLKNICTRVEYLKGTVDFDSRPGNGTLVAIHIPLP